MKPGTRALERHIEQLEEKIADLKPKAAAKPSPENGHGDVAEGEGEKRTHQGKEQAGQRHPNGMT